MPLSTPGVSGLPDDQLSQSLGAAQPSRTATVKTPTKFGRALELMSAGAYDPTGGLDTGQATPEAQQRVSGGKPTKFGALLNVIRPMLAGGAVGGFLGRSTPEGGFGAANNFFLTQRMNQMRMQELMRQLALSQSTIAKNQAETASYNRGGSTRIGQPVVGDNGNFWQTDPVTRELVDTGVKAPKKETPDQFEWDTDEQGNKTGVLVNRSNATARTVTVRGIPTKPPGRGTPDGTAASNAEADINGLSGESASGPSRVAAGTAGNLPPGMFSGQSKLPTKFNSGSPRLPNGGAMPSPSAVAAMAATGGASSNGSIPRTLTQTARPRLTSAETQTFNDLTMPVAQGGQGLSKEQAYTKIQAMRRGPDRTGDRNAKKDAETAAIEAHADAVMQTTGNDPDKALSVINADKNVPNQYKAAIRNRIRELARPGRPAKKPSALDLLNLPPNQVAPQSQAQQ